MHQEFINKQRHHERNKYTKEDLDLFTSIILKNKDKFIKNIKVSGVIIEENDKLLWKDFLLYFKCAFDNEIGDIYTGKISHILREILLIEQCFHVKNGIQLTFKEWINRLQM